MMKVMLCAVSLAVNHEHRNRCGFGERTQVVRQHRELRKRDRAAKKRRSLTGGPESIARRP
jgi:hypothetical protein